MLLLEKWSLSQNQPCKCIINTQLSDLKCGNNTWPSITTEGDQLIQASGLADDVFERIE